MRFQASGIPLSRLLIPLMAIGLLFSSISFIMNDYFLPLGTINFAKLYRQLIYTNPQLELDPYSVKRYQNTVLVTGNVDKRSIDHLLIIDRGENNSRRVITATNAQLTQNGQQSSTISLDLKDVFSVSVPAGKPEQYDYVRSSKMIYNILLKNITLSIQNPTASEMSSVDLSALIQRERGELADRRSRHMVDVAKQRFRLTADYRSFVRRMNAGTLSDPQQARKDLDKQLTTLQAAEKRTFSSRILQINELELYKKFSIPFACVIFTIFAFPVALFARRSGRVVGFGIGVLVSVIYWAMLLAGITLGTQESVSPFLAMWAPDMFFLLAGSVLFAVRLRR